MLPTASLAFEPCIPTQADRPPSGPGWIHEIKHDGYRLIARRDGAGVRVHGEFVITLRLAFGTDRGNGAAKRSDQARHGRAAVRQIFLLVCCH